jgi:hypothetical protein
MQDPALMEGQDQTLMQGQPGATPMEGQPNEEDLPPPPPTLIRQNAQVMSTAIIGNVQYPIQNFQGDEIININGTIYNLMNDANGRYIIMSGTNTPAEGGRRRSRRTKRSKSRRSRRV